MNSMKAPEITDIVLVDDHHVIRQYLRTILETEPGFRVIGEAADGVEAARLMEYLRPQVLVVDIRMPGMSGLEVARQVNQDLPKTRIVITSGCSTEAYALAALRAGAMAYVSKDSVAQELVPAIHEVIAGRRFFSLPLSELTIAPYQRKLDNNEELPPIDD
ncbi:MAG: response regulator transcription factor [Dehalococcoidales bacterium]|nr:response regulator transcription factor [Dehalococcoidales bacterium]